ncbi:hypothetical protein PIB30_036729 [Stylosanthes scabra]|uniref:Uncharacterized protein n=1 Tax=Stylosanthes scabra TaxID=79078 RepID=A0ABU6RDJ6_9FABA|nr:hypothetical protein [Stylosanthes scabra]
MEFMDGVHINDVNTIRKLESVHMNFQDCCMFFNTDGHQVPQQIFMDVRETFKRILEETGKVRDEDPDDMSA